MAADTDMAKITYFDARGRVEVIRLLLELSGTPYTERQIELDEWASVKAEFPHGQLPLYEDGELTLHQSHAIYRHLARRFDLYGDNEAERVRCDMVEEFFVDAQNKLGGFFWDPEFHDKRDAFENEELPVLLDRANMMLEANPANSGFFSGNRISFVDFIAWHFLDYVRPFSQQSLDRYPKLVAFKQGIESIPAIASYLDSERRPKTLTVAIAPFGGSPETS